MNRRIALSVNVKIDKPIEKLILSVEKKRQLPHLFPSKNTCIL